MTSSKLARFFVPRGPASRRGAAFCPALFSPLAFRDPLPASSVLPRARPEKPTSSYILVYSSIFYYILCPASLRPDPRESNLANLNRYQCYRSDNPVDVSRETITILTRHRPCRLAELVPRRSGWELNDCRVPADLIG